MNKQALILVVVIALLGSTVAFSVATLANRGGREHSINASEKPRIVSLSPAITETLFAIGAGSDVVGRTRWCDYPEDALKLPVVGTTLTPSYEDMVRQKPTLIVGEATKDAPVNELARIAHTKLLPWLSLADTVAGIRELGRLTGRTEAAEKIAADMERKLNVKPPASGPRVLLAMDGTPGQLNEVWFLRQNSIHGACLNAAGARNAVEDEFVGVSPVLSLERVIKLDPDVIVVLTVSTLNEAQRKQLLADWSDLPMLRAVKSGKVIVLDGRDYYRNGPRIVELVDKLKEALK